MQGKRFLIVDDDQEMRRWLRASLEPLGIVVDEAESGCETLRRLSEGGPFDLVITDERMPAPNGLEVIARARARGLSMPFVVVTGFSDEDLRLRAAQLAQTIVIDKPFEVRDLIALARALLAAPQRE
jgi:CheY-like chemotaxis protein